MAQHGTRCCMRCRIMMSGMNSDTNNSKFLCSDCVKGPCHLLLALIIVTATACSSNPAATPAAGKPPGHHSMPVTAPPPVAATPVLNLNEAFNLGSIIPTLAHKRVVFIG